MKKRFIPALILIIYTAILIKVMVFKDLPVIRVGQLMLNFGGTAEGQANFIPFKTIIPYLFGYKGWIIAGINLLGNIALLIPIGFLVPFLYRNMSWKKSLLIGFVAGLAIEVAQVVLRVGIFDIDDVILNALGVMIGYGVFAILARWIRLKQYKAIGIAASLTVVAAIALHSFVVYPMTHQVVDLGVGADSTILNVDLCGGTGGVGQISAVGKGKFTIKRTDGKKQSIILSDQVEIKTPNGAASEADLKIGDRVTLVGDSNPNGSFTAHTVLVCGTQNPKE